MSEIESNGNNAKDDWLNEFDSQVSDALSGTEEDRKIKEMTKHTQQVSEDLKREIVDFPIEEQQYIIAQISAYRSAPHEEKDLIIERLKQIIQLEEDYNKRKSLEVVIEQIMKSE